MSRITDWAGLPTDEYEQADNKTHTIDHSLSSTTGHPETDCDDSSEVFYDCQQNDTMPPVWANIVFDLTEPEGERRLREMLDAPKAKLVLWELDEWLRSLVRYGIEGTSVAGLAVDEALQEVRKRIWLLCDDHGIRLDEE